MKKNKNKNWRERDKKVRSIIDRELTALDLHSFNRIEEIKSIIFS